MTVFSNDRVSIAADITIGVTLIASMIVSLLINPIVIIYHYRKRYSEAKVLFVLLGLSDFLTLFLTPIAHVSSFLRKHPDVIRTETTWFEHITTWNTEIMVQYSAFLTSLLSLTRCISISSPFYQFNILFIKLVCVFWFLYLVLFRIITKHFEAEVYNCEFVWDPFAQLVVPNVSCEQISEQTYKWIYVANATILQRSIWILVSVFSLVYTILHLKRRFNQISRKSEVTIVILTVAYLLAFIPMIIENVLWLSNSSILKLNSYYLYYVMVSYPGQLLSVINPMIIVIRSKDLQRYLYDVITKVFKPRVNPMKESTFAVGRPLSQPRISGLFPNSNTKDADCWKAKSNIQGGSRITDEK